MKLLVDFKKAVPVLARRFEFGLKIHQFLQLLGRGFFRDHGRGVGFQQGQEVVDVCQVFFIDLGHIGPTSNLHGHQAFSGQHLQSFTQGGAADAVFLGNFQLVDPAAGLKLARKNALPQQFGNFFVQGARGQGEGRHDWEL